MSDERTEEFDERTVELTQEEFDMVWELLLATSVAMKKGGLNAHRTRFQGIGQGIRDAKLTEKLRIRTIKVAGKMSRLVSTGDEPLLLKIVDGPPRKWWLWFK